MRCRRWMTSSWAEWWLRQPNAVWPFFPRH